MSNVYEMKAKEKTNDQLVKEVIGMRRKIVDFSTIVKIVETRDPYTAEHQQKVSKLAMAIARGMKLSQDKIEGIRLASLVHDIGKISIPAEILNKPSKLTEEEFNLIKHHPKTGYDI